MPTSLSINAASQSAQLTVRQALVGVTPAFIEAENSDGYRIRIPRADFGGMQCNDGDTIIVSISVVRVAVVEDAVRSTIDLKSAN